MKRFWDKVDKSSDCWEWTASTSKDGYGAFWIDGKTIRAHRFSYELAFGPISEDFCVCHCCDNRLCVNPDHLWEGTVLDNVRDRVAKGRSIGAAKGSKHHNAKLCELDVWLIKEIDATHQDIADWFGISRPTVTGIRLGKHWHHV